MNYCTNCGFRLPSIPAPFCTQCGSRIETPKKPEAGTSETTTNEGNATTVFLANARIGLNRWWRWVLASILILVIWQGIGIIPYLVACEYLNQAKIPQFSCVDFVITADSLIPGFILDNLMFIIGAIGFWITIKLIQKKTLTQVVTGRVTFDYNRVLYAVWIGLLISVVFLVLDLLFFNTDMTFRTPKPAEYVPFLLLAIVLIPCQAGFEEVFFRGYLFQGMSLLTKNKFVLVAILSLAFTALHLFNPEPYEYGFAPYVSGIMILSAFMYLLTMFDGGIELAVGYHTFNNLWIGLIMNTEVTALPSPSLFVLPMEHYGYFNEFISFIVLFVIFNRKYGWFSWKTLARTLRHSEISRFE